MVTQYIDHLGHRPSSVSYKDSMLSCHYIITQGLFIPVNQGHFTPVTLGSFSLAMIKLSQIFSAGWDG